MQDARTPPNVKGRGLDGRVCEGHCQIRTMRLPRSGSLGDGVLSLGLSPPMTLALRKPLSESVSRNVWTGQCPPLGSLQLLGSVGLPATFCWSPPTFPLPPGSVAPSQSPLSSPAAPAAPPAPSLNPPPTFHLGLGCGEFPLGSQKVSTNLHPFFRCPPSSFSSIHSKNSPLSPTPRLPPPWAGSVSRKVLCSREGS